MQEKDVLNDTEQYTTTFDAGDHVNPVKTVSFTYDKVGNLKTYDDAVTSGQYVYDDAYRKTTETVNYGAFQLMRIKQITAKDPAQNVFMNYQYNYDNMDNIIEKNTEYGNHTYRVETGTTRVVPVAIGNAESCSLLYGKPLTCILLSYTVTSNGKRI